MSSRFAIAGYSLILAKKILNLVSISGGVSVKDSVKSSVHLRGNHRLGSKPTALSPINLAKSMS
ncbi:MAG: hypothetical protein OXC62_12470 [Aestuariivita sp.]|nr:hypothetical protein [Aestuariivita sp.]